MYIKNFLHISRLFYTEFIILYPDNDVTFFYFFLMKTDFSGIRRANKDLIQRDP